MKPKTRRKIRIIIFLTIYGMIYGAVAGGLSGMLVGLAIYIIGVLFGIPYGIFYGIQVGVCAGFAASLVTLWFDARSTNVTRAYRVAMAIICALLTPISIYFICRTEFLISPDSDAALMIPLALMLLGTLFALYMSQKLVNVYRKRFIETRVPTA